MSELPLCPSAKNSSWYWEGARLTFHRIHAHMCLQTAAHPQYTHSGTHIRQNQTREVGGSHGVSELEVWVQGPEVPRPDHPHLPHRPLEREVATSLQIQARRHSLARSFGHQRQPPGGASIHLVSWMRGWENVPQLGHLRPLRSEGETPGLCHALPPAPAEFLSISQRPGQLSQH